MTEYQVEKAGWCLFGAGTTLVLMGFLIAVFSRAHLPVAGLLNAFLILTALFAVMGAGFGLASGMTANRRLP